MTQSAFDFTIQSNVTPMMKQYFAIKANHSDCILFYRMGDFYEMFFDDAITASEILGIALTKRGKHDNLDIPMCGVPYHSGEVYIKTLLLKGLKVAICEQTESPIDAKKRGHKAVVNREVVRIITPGTIIEDNILNSSQSNYLISLFVKEDTVSIAFADISTGEIATTTTEISCLSSELNRINPVEIICSEKILNEQLLAAQLIEFKHIITSQVSSFFEYNRAEKKFKDYYKVMFLDGIGNYTQEQIVVTGSLLEYIALTQKNDNLKLRFPKIYNISNFMVIDSITRKSLELFESNNSKLNGSLINTIDSTKTPSGARLLRNYLSSPLVDPAIINLRLDLIEIFITNKSYLNLLQALFKQISDAQRYMTRLILDKGGPRDLLVLAKDLKLFSEIRTFIYNHFEETPSYLEQHLNCLEGFSNIITLIDNTILTDAPLHLKDGRFIARNINNELDQLLDIRDNANAKIQVLRQKYVENLGINNLKISKNNLLGYFIEVTPSNLSRVNTEQFILRQTMVNVSRFTTIELRELEDNINSAEDRILSIETEIFKSIRDNIGDLYEQIMLATNSIATLDVASSLAYIAIENNYSRPILSNDNSFVLKNARHPVVEKFIQKSGNVFTANDINLEADSKIIILTGPNMAGKSTYLRQNALCAILAQIGSFVPADFAKIGIIDRIFTRVGASDDLASGKSTFMVEMVETAIILNQATSRSLVILDEVGRGTSTYDGVAIAKSVIEYISQNIASRTIFATHYHELVSLESESSQIQNYTMSVKEWDNKIIFLHKIVKGFADRSYGIHVAELAGFPKIVIERANQVLKQLERQNSNNNMLENCGDLEENMTELEKIIKETDLENLTAKQAYDLIYQFKHLV